MHTTRVAPVRTHFPASPSRLLALREEGMSWNDVAKAAGISRNRLVEVLGSVGYWSRHHPNGGT